LSSIVMVMASLSHGRKDAVGGAVQDEQVAQVRGAVDAIDSLSFLFGQ
jgi:hypothetical protein